MEMKDLRIESWPIPPKGGMHTNGPCPGIQITHVPSGVVVVCDSERSQHKNREKALEQIKDNLLSYYQKRCKALEVCAGKYLGWYTNINDTKDISIALEEDLRDKDMCGIHTLEKH